MCRSIKVLRRPGQSTTPDELHAAALQFVRKISGFRVPSRTNQEAFERAVLEIADSSHRLLESIGSRARKPAGEPAISTDEPPEPRSVALSSQET
jgi:hypothetical protein